MGRGCGKCQLEGPCRCVPDRCKCADQGPCTCGAGPDYLQPAGGVIHYDPKGPRPMVAGSLAAETDPDYTQAHKDLFELHREKSRLYGTEGDKFANLVAVAETNNRDVVLYPLDRIVEKIVRVQNIMASGNVEDVINMEELLDIAGLALSAEALHRRALRREASDRW